MTYSFEKLEVWQKSRFLAKLIYQSTNNFPQKEKFGPTGQLRCSCLSVSSNIAEGSTKLTSKDKARYYQIAYGSLIEALNQSILANDLHFLPDDELANIRTEIDSIGRMINSLYKSTKKTNP
jgi:four helix bundle protein